MKVLFVLESGIQEYRNFLFERLAKEEQISELLILHTGKIYNARGNYNSKKVKIIGSNNLGFHLGIWKYIFKYDVVISSYNIRVFTCWLPVFFKDKFIFWGKGIGSNDNFLIKQIRQITANKAKFILVYNEVKKKEFLEKIRVNEKKLIAYTNTINISNSGFNPDSKKEYFLYFGRIQKRKGLEDLISQYSLYVNRIENRVPLKLRFVGNGEYVEELKNIAGEFKLQHLIEFYPGVYDDISIKTHFSNAVAYVSPYNVGLGIVNSFAYGVPIITCIEPQIGPEFYYLNNQNSIILNNISELNEIFLHMLDSKNQGLYKNCYIYYTNFLDSNIMYNNFLTTIIKAYSE